MMLKKYCNLKRYRVYTCIQILYLIIGIVLTCNLFYKSSTIPQSNVLCTCDLIESFYCSDIKSMVTYNRTAYTYKGDAYVDLLIADVDGTACLQDTHDIRISDVLEFHAGETVRCFTNVDVRHSDNYTLALFTTKNRSVTLDIFLEVFLDEVNE